MTIKKLFFLCLIVFALVVGSPLVTLISNPAYAQTASPKVSVTYNSKASSFLVAASGVQSVSYTLEYKRAAGSGQVLEGLQSAGKAAKNGSYARRHYAGTQSSKYFIPHKVKSGTLRMKGKTKAGKAFSKNVSFTVSAGGVLKVTSIN